MSQAHGKSMAIPFGRGTPGTQKGLLPCRLLEAEVTLRARGGGNAIPADNIDSYAMHKASMERIYSGRAVDHFGEGLVFLALSY